MRIFRVWFFGRGGGLVGKLVFFRVGEDRCGRRFLVFGIVGKF